MNNQVANPKTEVPTGIEINEKDYLNNLLSCLKEMNKNYSIALTEASNENLYNNYKNIFDQICTLHREVYELMFKKGWYKLEQVDDKKISLKYNELNQKYTDLDK